jgi:hypothetical protein
MARRTMPIFNQAAGNGLRLTAFYAARPSERVRAARLRHIMALPFLLASILPIGGCHGQSPRAPWNSSHVPTYQPLPVDVSGFPRASDKAKLAEIASYMRERLVAHYVDAAHSNAILWQFHFFAPVRYFAEDCSTFVDLLYKEKSKAEDEQIVRVGAAAEDTYNRYNQTIPHSSLASGDRYDAKVDTSDRFPQFSPIHLEYFYCAEMPLPNVPPSDSHNRIAEKYNSETCRMKSEMLKGVGFYGKVTLANFHIRNFIINIVQAGRAISLESSSNNLVIRQRISVSWRGYIKNIEYFYQNGSKQRTCLLIN